MIGMKADLEDDLPDGTTIKVRDDALDASDIAGGVL